MYLAEIDPLAHLPPLTDRGVARKMPSGVSEVWGQEWPSISNSGDD